MFTVAKVASYIANVGLHINAAISKEENHIATVYTYGYNYIHSSYSHVSA